MNAISSGADENMLDQVRQNLASFWCELLQLDQVDVNDNFFELGGDSIKITLIASHIYEHFQIEMPLSTVFANPTIGTLAIEVLAVLGSEQVASGA